MAESSKKENGLAVIENTPEHVSSLTFDEKVIKKIAGFAASEVAGILAMSGTLLSGITDKITDMLKTTEDPTRGITVEMGEKQVAIDMKLICEYGRNMPEIFQNIIDKVGTVIKEMTGLEVVELNVHVADVLTKEEFERRKKIDLKPDSDIVQEIPESLPARRVE